MSSFSLRALTFEGRKPLYFPGVAAEVESCQSQYFQALEARFVGEQKMEVTPFDHMILVAIPHFLRRVTSYIYDKSVYIHIYIYISDIFCLTFQITREFISFLNAPQLTPCPFFLGSKRPCAQAATRRRRNQTAIRKACAQMARSRGVVA